MTDLRDDVCAQCQRRHSSLEYCEDYALMPIARDAPLGPLMNPSLPTPVVPVAAAVHEAHAFERAATRIIKWLHVAEQDLVGCTVELIDGTCGVVRDVRLDESHGLCFTCDATACGGDPDRYRHWKPVSFIKHVARGLQP